MTTRSTAVLLLALAAALSACSGARRAAPPAQAAAAPPRPAPSAGPSKEQVSRESEQHYLSGIIFFQKGDYAKAGDEWRQALAASPENPDAKAGLERLRALGVER
jgi:hypothetical protein